MIDGRDRVLPEQGLRRHLGSEVAGHRSHVAVSQLEPGLLKFLGQLLRVLEPAARDLLVDRIDAHREVGGQHHRLVALVRVRRVRNQVGAGAVLRTPLPCAARSLVDLPLVAVQRLEEGVVPLGGRRGPRALEAAGDGVGAVAGAVAVLPAQAHLLDGGTLGLRADVLVGIGGAVHLAERVATDGQGGGLDVVHGHAAEGLADVEGRLLRVGLTVGALGVDVDQTHLDRGEGVLEARAVTGVALVAQPGLLGAPVHVLLGLPRVDAAAGEAPGRQTHVLDGDVAGEHDQVGPGQLAAVLLLDRPDQTACLVEAGVVRPAVERSEALHAGAGAAASVLLAVGARGVPRHADEEGAVVPEVGGPPGLRLRHQRPDVLLDRVQVEGLELGLVVEVLAHGIAHGRVLLEDLEVEGLRPPLTVAATLDRGGHPVVHHRTLPALGGAPVLRLVLVHLFFASDVVFGHEIPLRSVGCSLVCVTE